MLNIETVPEIELQAIPSEALVNADVSNTFLKKQNIMIFKAVNNDLATALSKLYIAFGEKATVDQVIKDFNATTYAKTNNITFLDTIKVGKNWVVYFTCDHYSELLKELMAKNCGYDFANLAVVPDIEQPGLYCSDMDMTSIQVECINLIAEKAGVGELVKAITQKAMNGTIDYDQSITQRVAALKGVTIADLESTKSEIKLTKGLEHILTYLRQYDWKSALVSGGFKYYSDYLRDKCGFDYDYSNELEIVDDQLTGKVVGKIVGPQEKCDFMLERSQELGISRFQTIAIGDGANDIQMIKGSECGIAFHAKPIVIAQANIDFTYNDLSGVVALLEARRYFKNR